MTTCKWCNRPLEGVGVAACKGQRTCTHRSAFEEGEEQGVEQGCADERAAVVAWLRDETQWPPELMLAALTIAQQLERLPKGKP